MSKILRLGFLSVPALAGSFAIVAACSSDPTGDGAPTPDASRDQSVLQDGSTDTSTQPDVFDGGQVDGAAEAAPPALCKVYPNAPADAAVTEGPRNLYELIALRALLAAVDSCEIGAAFPDLEDPPPSQITCFGKQLASISGCLVGGAPTDYSTLLDENGAACVSAVGGEAVQLGFRNPKTGGYTIRDVDFLIALTKKAALSTGMPAADVDRLEALLEAKKPTATTDAGDGGAFSQSTCP